MKINKLLILAVVLLTFGLTACKKEKDDGLTKETQIGANTFSCRINGAKFFTKQNLFSPKPIFASYYDNKDPYFLLSGRNYAQQTSVEIDFEINGVLKVGTYPLNNLNGANIEYRYIESDIYLTDKNHTGEITFTRVDHVAKIYAGRFSFVGINKSGKIIKISSGRFDVKL